MTQQMYRVGVDCRLSGTAHAGIGRYIQHFIREAVVDVLPIQWVLFFSSPQQATNVLGERRQRANIECIYVPDLRHYTLAEQVHIPSMFTRAKLDLLHVPHFNIPLGYRGKIVITIHDLLWHQYRGAAVTTLPGWKYWPKYLAYRLIVREAVRRAKHIYVPTQTVSNELLRYYPHARKKTLVTSEGVDPVFFRLRSRTQKRSKQLLYVGSLYPHKNVSVVLRALQLLPHHTLTIVSARSIFHKHTLSQAKQLRVDKQLTFAGKLTDDQLITTLHNSLALVQPSRSEGFGLTGIEAMATGTPVLAADTPIFQEVYQNQAKFFSVDDPGSLADAVHHIEKESEASPSKSIKKATERQAFARQYSWPAMTHIITSSYLSICSTS